MEISPNKDGSFSAFFRETTKRERENKLVTHCGFISDGKTLDDATSGLYEHCCAISGALCEKVIDASYQF